MRTNPQPMDAMVKAVQKSIRGNENQSPADVAADDTGFEVYQGK